MSSCVLDIFEESMNNLLRSDIEHSSNWVVNIRDSTKEVLSLHEKVEFSTTALANKAANQKYFRPTEKQQSFPDVLLFFILFGCLSIAYVSAFHRKRFKMLTQTAVNWKLSKQIIRYEKVYSHPVNIALNLNFLISVSLFFGLSYYYLIPQVFSFNAHFFVFLLGIIIYLMSKLFLYKFTAWLWKREEVMEEYIFQTNLFNKYLGVIYLLLTALLLYSNINSEVLINTGFVFLFLLLCIQLIRGVIIGKQSDGNLLLIILYLCTLEILPWLFIGKWIDNQL